MRVEVAGQRAALVMANRNGIFVNGGGFLNTDKVTLTTGNLHMKDGDLVGIDVTLNYYILRYLKIKMLA